MYNGSTQQQQQQQPTSYYYHHHHHNHHQHQQQQQQQRSKRATPELVNNESPDPYSNQNGYYQIPITTPAPPLPIQCSAYFIHRLDLDNYSVYTLRQTVDRVVTGPKSKGLKVRLTLPDDGLIIENIPDPNQSWMYKTTELLYFWRDPYYSSIIVVVTINRSYYHSSGPYSASIFRLRGNESVQLFIQRAQQFFAQLSTPSTTKTQSKGLNQQSVNTENVQDDNNRKSPRKKSKQRSESRTKSNNSFSRSLQPSPARSPGTSRTEFDPTKSLEKNSSFSHYNRRTYSETTVLSDTHTDNSIKFDTYSNGDNTKSPSAKVQLSDDLVAELMRELKEIRSEIAELKLEARQTPVRAASTSPFLALSDDSKDISRSSPSIPKVRSLSDIDAGTQTDFSLTLSKLEDLSEHSKSTHNGSNGVSTKTKHKHERSSKYSSSNKSNDNENDREENPLVKFYPINGTTNGTHSSSVQEDSLRKPTLIKPRPILKISENDLLDSTSYASLNKNQSNSNSMEEDMPLKKTPIVIEKEIPKVLSSMGSSSTSKDNKSLSSSSMTNGSVVSFRSSLDNTLPMPEHFYENFPILIRMDTNQGSFYNVPMGNMSDSNDKQPHIYVTLADDGNNNEVQQKYLSQLFGSQNGIALLIPPQSLPNNSSSMSSIPSKDNNHNSSTKEEVSSNNPQYPQQVLFADHLTNPLFNIDKQLLANTIANQFGVDKNSPYLEQLIANQHLFVTEKRTFANMVWQMTQDEINAICSSPVTTIENHKIKMDYNGSISKSILKSNKLSRSITKKQRIKWDRSLE